MFPTVSQLLDNFTDVFHDGDGGTEEVLDEIFSQPLSLPTTCDSPQSITNGLNANGGEVIRPAKHTGQHGEFRSVEEIDPKFRCLFTYPYFNLVQSRIIEDALYSDKSLVVCAPTGSGKTVVFELAILQLLMQVEDAGNTGDFKIIYMAPVKAVCNERLTEWYPKLTKLGLLCIEVTGDTDVDFSQLSPYRVIITTPEKWDMLTRRWRDHRGLVEMIKLFLIDEVHILNDETRGPVLEAVVSRMKTVESAAQSAHRIEQLQLQYQGMEPTSSSPPSIRFVAISATVSNPQDVADWLGTDKKPAVFHKFGDECRPVKLKRVVEGYPCAEGTSIFKFDLILNYKLWPIIQKYYDGKPTLIFCNTRKSVALTAEALSREVTVGFSPDQKAKLTALASTLKNKKLQMLIMSGVGCHHAGLLYEERVNIERAFRNRDLPILITTTTLAMGVNLPAHLVIVKNTQQYVNGAYQEYSMSTVLQMVGRAGRPQYDTEATAVIMTRLQDKPRYQALVGGSEPLQSYLHKRLAENLNSEAALGTVTDVAQCVEWLRSTFLYVRAARDPKRYLGLPHAAPQPLILKKIEELCVKAMNSLASSGLITMDEASCIESTEAGRLMSLFYMDVETMKNIMKVEGSESLERLLWLICESHELSDMHLRVDERRCLNLLNRNNKAATIRFPMKGKISTRQMKLNCIIQAILGCLQIPEPALNQEAMKVMRTASRVCKCLVKYVTRPELVSQQAKKFSAVLNSIILSKCIEAHLWENSPYVSKQLKGIGPTFSTLLASAGVTSFMMLEASHPRDLERIMNKGPPAGNLIRKQVCLLPKYQLTVTPIDARSVSIHLALLNLAHLSENMEQLTAGDGHKSYLVVGDSENHLLLLTQFTDRDFISVYDGTMKYEVTRKLCSEHKIFIHCVSSTIVGVDVQADYLFLDLEPPAPREYDHVLWSDANVPRPNVAVKQTAITDIYRERKRKSAADITQCKEKKKREYNLTEKLKALKESFSKTSKTLKTDVDKSVEMSNKVIHDLLEGKHKPRFPENKQAINKLAVEGFTVDLTKSVGDPIIKPSCAENSQVMKETVAEYPTVDLTKNSVVDTMEEIIVNDDDDYIDDYQIDSILSKIESEISGNDQVYNNNNTSNNIPAMNIPTKPCVHVNVRPIAETEKVELKYKKMNDRQNFVNKSNRCIKDPNKRKTLKNNYSFMDVIEKKANTSEDTVEKNADTSIDSGFSEAIKSQINKFLQMAQNTTKQKTPVIHELLDNSTEQLPEVFVKKDLPTETYTHLDSHDQGNDKTQSPMVLHDTVKYEHPDLNNGNLDITETTDLPEVNVKSAPTKKSNPYEGNQECDREDEGYNEIKGNSKLNMYEIQQDNDNLLPSNNYGTMFSATQLSTALTINPIAEYKDITKEFVPSNVTWDDTNPLSSLETTSMTMPQKEKVDLTKENVKPVPNLELNQHAKIQEHSNYYSCDTLDQKTTLHNNMDVQENNPDEESKKCDENREMLPIMPVTNLVCNPVKHYQYSPVNIDSNSYNFTRNKNLPVKASQIMNELNTRNLDVAVVDENIKINSESNQYVESQLNHNSTLTKSELMIIKNNRMHTKELLQEGNHPGHSHGYGQTTQLPTICMNNNLTRPKESLKNIANIPIKSLGTMTKQNYRNNAVIPYHRVEITNQKYSHQPTVLHSYIPYSNSQNTFGEDNMNDMLVEKNIYSNYNAQQRVVSDYITNGTNLVQTDQIRAIEPNEDSKSDENLISDICQPDNFHNVSRMINKDAYIMDTKYMVNQDKQEHSKNRTETHFKRFSYTATKVDVCTKKYAPDHELRITRKLNVEVDVTEILKQEKSNKTNGRYNRNTNKGNDHMKPKQDNDTPHLCQVASPKEITKDKDIFNMNKPDLFKNIDPKSTLEAFKDNKNLEQSKDTTNICEKAKQIHSEENETLTNTTNRNENIDATKDTFVAKNEKPKYFATNNSVGNILQKYSKILVKPETATPTVNNITKKIDNTTSAKNIDQPTDSVHKHRKPFKISDINSIDIPLSANLTIPKKTAVTDSHNEPFLAAKRIKPERENLELYEAKNMNVTLTPKIDINRSFESPVSVHSLLLDPIEDEQVENAFNPKDMKDESMFNPRLLLQLITEGNETTDIIAPPADFSDNAPAYFLKGSQEIEDFSDNVPLYSPIASQETKEFSSYDDLQTENIEDNFNSCDGLDSSLQSPKEVETWCLSKEEEDTYEPPVRSAPWVVSQRAHTNLGARRAKLCQFKFVRKKTFRP